MHISELGNGEVTYTHQDPDTKEFRTFAVARISEWILENLDKVERVSIPIDKGFAKFILANRGIEQHRLIRLLLSGGVLEPITLIRMPDQTCLIIDGNHRYVVAAMGNLISIPGYIVSLEQAGPFLVEGVPTELAEHVLTGFSGIE